MLLPTFCINKIPLFVINYGFTLNQDCSLNDLLNSENESHFFGKENCEKNGNFRWFLVKRFVGLPFICFQMKFSDSPKIFQNLFIWVRSCQTEILRPFPKTCHFRTCLLFVMLLLTVVFFRKKIITRPNSSTNTVLQFRRGKMPSVVPFCEETAV